MPTLPMINSIDHFTHPGHRLVLLQLKSADTGYLCDGCKTPGEGTRYRCDACEYDLHEYCGTCPTTLSSFMHPHPLTRVAPTEKADERTCDVCGDLVEGLFYRCKECEFDVHPICTRLPQYVRHAMHQDHKLSLQGWGTTPCAVCRGACTSWRYRCGPCGFDIHMDCILVPCGDPATGAQPSISSFGQPRPAPRPYPPHYVPSAQCAFQSFGHPAVPPGPYPPPPGPYPPPSDPAAQCAIPFLAQPPAPPVPYPSPPRLYPPPSDPAAQGAIPFVAQPPAPPGPYPPSPKPYPPPCDPASQFALPSLIWSATTTRAVPTTSRAVSTTTRVIPTPPPEPYPPPSDLTAQRSFPSFSQPPTPPGSYPQPPEPYPPPPGPYPPFCDPATQCEFPFLAHPPPGPYPPHPEPYPPPYDPAAQCSFPSFGQPSPPPTPAPYPPPPGPYPPHCDSDSQYAIPSVYQPPSPPGPYPKPYDSGRIQPFGQPPPYGSYAYGSYAYAYPPCYGSYAYAYPPCYGSDNMNNYGNNQPQAVGRKKWGRRMFALVANLTIGVISNVIFGVSGLAALV